MIGHREINEEKTEADDEEVVSRKEAAASLIWILECQRAADNCILQRKTSTERCKYCAVGL